MPEALALLRETSDPPDGKEGASTPQHSWSYDTCRTRRDAQLAEGGTSRQEFPVKQAHPAKQELLSSQELHGRPVLLRKPDHHMLHPRQMPQHSLTQTPLT